MTVILHPIQARFTATKEIFNIVFLFAVDPYLSELLFALATYLGWDLKSCIS